jgi:hypothetical protein
MRLASFNLENIFDRAKALNQDTIAEGKVALDRFSSLNKRFDKPTYSPTDKDAILQGLKELGVLKDDNAGEFARLRQNRGKLLKRPKSGPVEVVAAGRGEWIGWLELFTKVERAGVFRKGMWGGKNGTLFPHFPEMTKPMHAASDHAAIFVDLNI